MSSEPVITIANAWKKYSKQQVLNNSLREELVSVITGKKSRDELAEGEFWALRDIVFSVRRGECLGLSGNNGSGKSTILKLIANVTYPTRGAVQVRGRVAPLIELGAGMHPDLTGMENIYMNGTILGLSLRELKSLIPEIIAFSELDDFIHVPVKKYSSGMYLRLAFSIAIHSDADIFLFDEILAVGDEEFQKKCIERIYDIKRSGRTIIVVSHDSQLLERISNCVISLKRGEVVKTQG